MASDNEDDNKPNLRPNKFLDAAGKSLGTCYCLRQSWSGSCISATWNDRVRNQNEQSFDKPGLFGIDRPFVQYSLEKRQRWKVFDDFRRNMVCLSDSSSDGEASIHSESEERATDCSTAIAEPPDHDEQDTHYVEVIGWASERCRNKSRRPRSQQWMIQTTKPASPYESYHANVQNEEQREKRVATGITYTAVLSSRKKQIPSIRNHHRNTYYNRRYLPRSKKFSALQEHGSDDAQALSSDNDESPNSPSVSTKLSLLQLNDFLPSTTAHSTVVTNKHRRRSSRKSPNEIAFDAKKNPFRREMSREEKLYHRDMAAHVQQPSGHNPPDALRMKSPHYLMPLSFRSVALDRTELTLEYLSKTYGNNFIHAQCYPTKYLVGLTDRLKASSWSEKPALFPMYSTLTCYLVLILNEPTTGEENICQGHVSLNIDLSAEALALSNLSRSENTIYGVEELIEKAVELLVALPLERFKPIDSAISRRRLPKDGAEHEFSDSEFLNQQIRQVHSLSTNELQKQLTMNEEEKDDASALVCTRPGICTTCCEDMTDCTPMTALTTCGHWLCNDCWKQYLQNSIQHVRLITCPEWNCSAVVDAGTILSLVNVRCLTIYERHIEKCLVNLSRSYVRCPLTSCSSIIQIIGSTELDYVQCRCGHQFCLDCKEEPHFPITCRSYRVYIDILKRNGDSSIETTVVGRKCISCQEFIEKNGGCNQMRCRCGVEFCWICTGLWREHSISPGIWKCPKEPLNLQERILTHDSDLSRERYADAIHHRHQRTYQIQSQLEKNARRLIGTIPIEKDARLDQTSIKIQFDKRQALLEHCHRMLKYIDYLHRICEFTAVANEGYGSDSSKFFNSLYRLQSILLSLTHLFEAGRGYSAIEQFNELYQRSEHIIERLRRAVRLRRLHRVNAGGYITS